METKNPAMKRYTQKQDRQHGATIYQKKIPQDEDMPCKQIFFGANDC